MRVSPARRLIQSSIRLQSAASSSSAPAEGQLYQWGKFDWEDPFNMDARLTEDEIAFRDAFKRYCDEKLMTRIVMDNRNERKFCLFLVIFLLIFDFRL